MKDKRVLIKQVDYLYNNTLSALVAIFVLSVVIYFSFEGLVDSTNLTIWILLSLSVIALRVTTYFLYKKATISVDNIDKYYYIFLEGFLASGILWGVTAFFIMPPEKEYQILLLLIIGGLTSGATVSASSRVEMFYAYLLLSMIPFLYVFLFMNGAINTTVAAFTTLWIVILFFLARKTSKNINDNILLGFENEKLIEQLQHKIEEANRSNEAKSRFLSTMSHEIRTPMNAIIGFIHILKKMESNPEKLKYLNTIDSSSNLLLNILNDILDISKIEAGKLSIEKTAFNPKEEFEHLYEFYKAPCEEKGVQLINSIDSNLPQSIESDKLRLKQIITNLLSNALKFTPATHSIEFIVKFNSEDSTLYVSIKDEGIGIAPDNIETILEEFSQADNSTARKYGGTGLGLSIVSKLLQLLGSKLEIESELGKGSNFSFQLPVKVLETEVTQPIESEMKEESESVDFSTKRVLVAEDNKTNQMLIEILLEDMNLEVSIANDGVEAERMFQEGSFDIILMDINMPNKNGIEAMQAIKRYDDKDVKTPIVALTANAVNGDKERYIEEGFDDYLAKPIDHDALTEVLKKHL